MTGTVGSPHAPTDVPARSRRRWWLIAGGVLLAVTLAAVLVVLLADTPGARLARAVDNTIGQGSAQTTITGTVRDVPFVGDLTLSIAEGELDFDAERARLTRELPLVTGVEIPGVGRVGEVELVYADGGAWLRAPLDTERSWLRVRDAEQEPGAASSAPGLGNPITLLALLRAIEQDPAEVEDDVVDGVEATRFRVLVDLDALEGEVGGASQEMLDTLQRLHEDGRLPLDLWVDEEQDLLLRVGYEVDVDLPGAPEIGLGTEVDLHDHGAPVAIEPPPDDEVADLSAEGLRGLDPLSLLRDWLERLPGG